MRWLIFVVLLGLVAGKIPPFNDAYGDLSWNDDGDDCGDSKKDSDAPAPSMFSITSDSIREDGLLMMNFGCSQQCGMPSCPVPSMQLSWANAPSKAKSLILMIDRATSDPPHYIHWLLADIDPASMTLASGASGTDSTLNGAQEWANSSGSRDYQAPCGLTKNDYRLTVFAMKSAHSDLAPFFFENPTALAGEVQHYLLGSGNVTDVQVLRFFWPAT